MKFNVLFLLTVLSGLAFSQAAYIIDQTNAVTDVYSSTSFKVYADTFGLNPDLGMRLCNVGQRYVAAVYSANVGGTYTVVPVSWNLTTGSTDTLVYTSNAAGGGCFDTPIDAFAFSQFRDNTRTPQVRVSAFPGRIHALYSNNVDGSGGTYLGIYEANGYLRGSYSVSRSFNQATGMVTANVNSITFDTDVGDITRNPNDADWGLSSSTGRLMLMALCTDDIGDVCSDAAIVNDSAELPIQLNLGAPTNDQVVYDRNVVVDGLDYGLCIGTDLTSSIISNPSNIYFGANSTITITVTNNGNVNVTTNFPLVLNVTGPGGYTLDIVWTITENLGPGDSTTRNVTWNATGPAGTYTFTSRADEPDTIAECNEANNDDSTNVVVSPYYVLHVEIDGNETNVFPHWGRPYNVTMWITDSDNNTLVNPRYLMTETNGLNPFTPTQVWNNSGGIGLKSYNVGEMTGNGTGYIQLTMIPTCNLLYTVYSAEGVDAFVGNYSMIVNAYNPGALIFAYNGSLTYDHPLLVGNQTCTDPGWVNSKQLVNQNKYVLWVYDWLYEVYSITKKLVKP